MDEELISCTAGEPVAGYAEVFIHEVPLVMSPVMQATGWRIVLTWIIAPLVFLLCTCVGYDRGNCSRCSFLHVFGL